MQCSITPATAPAVIWVVTLLVGSVSYSSKSIIVCLARILTLYYNRFGCPLLQSSFIWNCHTLLHKINSKSRSAHHLARRWRKIFWLLLLPYHNRSLLDLEVDRSVGFAFTICTFLRKIKEFSSQICLFISVLLYLKTEINEWKLSI